MYIIRDKNVKAILKTLKAPLEDNLTPEEVFPGFDPGTMEMAKLPSGILPKYFDIDEEGFVKKLNKKQHEALRESESVSLMGSTGADSEETNPKTRSLLSPKEADRGALIEARIAEKYPPGREMKIIKAYMDWIVEGQPEGDERVGEYREMQEYIKKVKDKLNRK
jgi:hypothetical protein